MAKVFGDQGGSVYEVVPSWTADQQRAAWFGNGGAPAIPMMQVAPQVAAAQGYANAGAQAAGRAVQSPQAAVNGNPATQMAPRADLTVPGQSNMMINPAQAGTAGPIARLETQPSPGLQGRDGIAANSAQAAGQPNMQIDGFSPNGFQIITPNNNQIIQGAANAGVLPNAGMAQNRYNVKFDKGEYDATTGTMKLDFTKYGGSTFTGTFAEMQKMGASGLNKLFGNFHNGVAGNQNSAGAAATAEKNRASIMQQAPQPSQMPLPPQRPATAAPAAAEKPSIRYGDKTGAKPAGAAGVTPQQPAGAAVTPGGTGGSGTSPQKLGDAGQQSSAGAQQMAGVLNAQQYLAELQSPELATALKMLAIG